MSDKEFKFVVCVEWDSLEGFGFYVFLDDDLDWLIKRIAKAQKLVLILLLVLALIW